MQTLLEAHLLAKYRVTGRHTATFSRKGHFAMQPPGPIGAVVLMIGALILFVVAVVVSP